MPKGKLGSSRILLLLRSDRHRHERNQSLKRYQPHFFSFENKVEANNLGSEQDSFKHKFQIHIIILLFLAPHL
jgi:GH25 family lysozyme M1 (1,4-beta-N-acetylmuramidase)